MGAVGDGVAARRGGRWRSAVARVAVAAEAVAVRRPCPADGNELQGERRLNKDVRFVVPHAPGPLGQAGRTLREQPGVMAHVGHSRTLLDADKLALGGPHLDDRGGGRMIPAAGVTVEEITAFAADDPAVRYGLPRFEVRPWLIGISGTGGTSGKSE
jgi:hypothetical protein